MENEEQPSPPPPALLEGWSRDHHLIGHKTSISFLRPDENSQYYHQTEESVQVAAFQTENPAERQPALWRNLLATGENGKVLAVDYVAADTQDGSTKNMIQTANVQLVQERMETAILKRIYNEILPDLVLVAALEEVRSQFLKATDRHLQKSRSKADNSNRISTKESPPDYYGLHPNQYMKPPVQSNTKDATKDDGPPPSSSFSFTPNQLVSRIKAGCQLAYSRIEMNRPSINSSRSGGDRRSSSRLARLAEQQHDDGQEYDDDEIYNYWKVTTGGNVATFIMERYANQKQENGETSAEQHEKSDPDDANAEEEEDEEDDQDSVNPYIRATDEDITEWLGKKTAKLISNSDLQTSFAPLLFQEGKKGKKKIQSAELGKVALDIMSDTDQKVWLEAMERSTQISEDARLCIECLTYDDATQIEDWETAQFGRSSFALRLIDENDKEQEPPPADDTEILRYKEDKTWSIWRYKGIHGGYTVWPSWRSAVEEWRNSQMSDSVAAPPEANAEANATDRDLAQAMAQEETAQSSGRRTRRGGETGTVFYGNQSTMTLKQMMDAMLRITSLRPFATMLDLLAAIQDDSTDPIRRMRNALGRIVYKRNQLARLEATTEMTDTNCAKQISSPEGFHIPESNGQGATANGNVYDAKDIARLAKYMKELLAIELWLRRLVMDRLTHIPVEVIATAADERTGMIESIDDVDFENPDELEWLSSGHELLGKLIFRPVETRPVDTPSQCYWFRIEEYVPTVEAPTEPGSSTADKPSLGRAKDTRAVERRIRFKALRLIPPGKLSATLAPNEHPLVLTEGQVRAGIKAAQLEDSGTENKQSGQENPMRGRSGAKISLVPVEGEGTQKTGLVAGHATCPSSDGTPKHKMLLTVEASNSGGNESLWAVLEGEKDGLHCRVEGEEGVLYSVQEFDYDPSSQAFKECKNIISQLERHAKIGPFMEPVDPIALNIPTYFQVIKRPMDMSTLTKKLENGDYSRFSLSETIGSTPVARMLNGPFRRDLELIFNNAILFNPPDDWIYKAANTLKNFAVKKIEQACQKVEALEFSRHRVRQSVYLEYDSDTDLYGYDDEKDEDYDGSSSNRKRKRTLRTPTKEDPCVKAIERGIPLQKLMPDGTSLRGPFGNFPVNSDAASFALPSDWTCHRTEPSTAEAKPSASSSVSNEIGELIELRSHLEDQNSASLRRSTRAATHEPTGTQSPEAYQLKNVEYDCDLLHVINCPKPTNRTEVEVAREQLHEEYYARVYKAAGNRIDTGSLFPRDDEDSPSFGAFLEGSFPPFFGSFFPTGNDDSGFWEIRSPFIVPALRWVIRGLVKSEHLGAVESLTDENLKSGVVVASNVYYYDESLIPFDVVDQKEFTRRKKAMQGDGANDSDDDAGMEMSDYEKLRQDRVARNAERLKALGLA